MILNELISSGEKFFSQVSTDNSTKYSALTDVIKMALLLPHGNAGVERGLSINNSLFSKERNQLSETTINGLRGTKDAVKFNDPEKMRPEKTSDHKACFIFS